MTWAVGMDVQLTTHHANDALRNRKTCNRQRGGKPGGEPQNRIQMMQVQGAHPPTFTNLPSLQNFPLAVI